MTEFISSLAILFTSATYFLGGQELPYFNRGFKWIRRFLLPLGLFLFMVYLGGHFASSLVSCLLLSVALHLGYQDKLYKFFWTGLLMGLPSILIGFYWTAFLPAVAHTLFGWISFKDNNFKHAWTGLAVGFCVGIAYLFPVINSIP